MAKVIARNKFKVAEGVTVNVGKKGNSVTVKQGNITITTKADGSVIRTMKIAPGVSIQL